MDSNLLYAPCNATYVNCDLPMLVFLAAQVASSSGKDSQSGRSNPNNIAVCHSSVQRLSLMFLHWPEVGWMETPEVSHNPNRCMHSNGIAAALHSGEGLCLRAGMSSLAFVSSSRSTKGDSPSSQFMESRVSSSILWHNPPSVG